MEMPVDNAVIEIRLSGEPTWLLPCKIAPLNAESVTPLLGAFEAISFAPLGSENSP
ncbi:TPA: hypothetical protein ACGU7N_004194 [Vibrio vulnificus]|uniref:hypothetical protein n=1 Tax=Vibrio vulnificus TaxID=672 RepID=UPI001E4B17D1|nr:hypothetical protein [Vibrio vulnificus]WHE22204.1 hypothetical protein PVE41_03435 [Vibrio vulnificus]WIL73265.1 hypothetical protein QPX65_10075 [Vibrio vulnificus]